MKAQKSADDCGTNIIYVPPGMWQNKPPSVSPLANKKCRGPQVQNLFPATSEERAEAEDAPPPPAHRPEFYVIIWPHGPRIELSILPCATPEIDNDLLTRAQDQGWSVLRWSNADRAPLRIRGTPDETALKELVMRNTPILEAPYHGALARRRIREARVILDCHPLRR